jgi:hypothetical protein
MCALMCFENAGWDCVDIEAVTSSTTSTTGWFWEKVHEAKVRR